MTDAKFDLNGIEFVGKSTREIESTVSNCAYDFEKICSTLDSDYSTFQSDKSRAENEVQRKISRVQEMIKQVENDKKSASQKKQKEKPYPPKPSIPEKASNEEKHSAMSSYQEQVRKIDIENQQIRKENQRIDEYLQKCDDTIEKLMEIVVKMRPFVDCIKKTGSHVTSVVEDFRMKIYETKNSNRRVVSVIQTFNATLSRVRDAAQRIILLEPRAIGDSYGIDKQFSIKNNHNHSTSPTIFSSNFISNAGNIQAGSYASSSATLDKSDIINENDVDAFFDLIEGKDEVSMPSGNVRKLGGKKFTDRMKQLGYETVIQDNGAIIDKNGIVHWEKKNG